MRTHHGVRRAVPWEESAHPGTMGHAFTPGHAITGIYARYASRVHIVQGTADQPLVQPPGEQQVVLCPEVQDRPKNEADLRERELGVVTA